MAQEDYILENEIGRVFRQDLNNTLQAIATNNSGGSAPSTNYPYQFWADTTSNKMKFRSSTSSTTWYDLWDLDSNFSGGSGSFTPTQDNLYSAVADIISAGANITVNENATNSTITISSSGGGGGGGLTVVARDSTLTGDGRSGTPLGVANEFTAADETKLDNLPTITSIGTNLTLSSGVLSADSQAFLPTQANIYTPVNSILSAGSNITLTADSTNNTITIASTGSGGGSFTPSQSNLYASVAAILGAGTNVSLNENSTDSTITISSTGGSGGGSGGAANSSNYYDATELNIGSTELTIANITFTPTSDSNKVMLVFNCTLQGDRTSSGTLGTTNMTLKVKRGATTIRTEAKEWATWVVNNNRATSQGVITIIDSPASTDAQVYTVTVTKGSGVENGKVFNRSLIILELGNPDVSFTPSQTNLYSAVAAILGAGNNVSLDEDSSDNTITISSTADSLPSGGEVGDALTKTSTGAQYTKVADLVVDTKFMYMVGLNSEYLSSINTTTGVATRVGSATRFGVGELSPQGLAAIGNTLYMVGRVNDCLYTVNIATGAATRVGSSTRFGVSETSPRGLAAIGNTLYMVGSTNDWLYTVNITTGVATRVGSSTQFGISEGSPTGLAAIGNTLYMVGTDTDCLYTVNTTTGVATRVGSSNGFGIGENAPYGLAAIGNTLYMVGTSNECLYTVNTTTGVATRVGSATQFGISEGSPTGLSAVDIGPVSLGKIASSSGGSNLSDGQIGYKAFSNPPSFLSDAEKTAVRTAIGVGSGNLSDSTVTVGTLYMVGSDEAFLSTVNTTTGVATRVGSSTQFGVNESEPTGLATIGNTLYMVGESQEYLSTVNTTTGVATRVGSASNFGVNEQYPQGLAAIGNTLYMVGDFNNCLYTVNRTTGVATRVGSATNFGVSESNPTGLAAIGNTLYMTGQTSPRLYTVNRTTGVATRVGIGTQFGVSERFPTGLAAIRNTLYMVGSTNDCLYTVNTTTGVATRVGNSSEFGISESRPTGLAAITTEYNLSQLLSTLI